MILQENDLNSTDVGNTWYGDISYQIFRQCSIRVKSQVWEKMLDEIKPQVKAQVKAQVRTLIETKLWNKL
jgi:hypothetical protein